MSTDIVQAGGALAIRADQTEWTPAQQAVLQQSGISNEVTAAELSGFLHLCQRTLLDPFSRQIYLIGRYDKRAGRTVFTPQTGIDGYRVIAHRVVAEARQQFGYEDTQWCDKSGQWRDVWLSDSPPAAAKVTVLRQGQRFSAVALFREYCQTGREGQPIGLWGKMPAGQVAKCAEALALRKAFPHDLAGVYTAEEMAQADNSAPLEQGSAQVRQLRRVQPGEPDVWQTDGPAEVASTAQAKPGRDWLAEARAAATAEQVRSIYIEAGAADAPRELAEQIAEIGRQKAAAAGEPVDAEIVEDQNDQNDVSAALDELRAAALAAGIAPTLDADFTQSYGVPIERATVEQLREMTSLLAGAA
jgi:phage recombination protein Bet